MRKSIRNRISLYLFYAALAVLFFIFDLTFLGWAFALMFVIPVVVGFILMLCNRDVTEKKKTFKDAAFPKAPPAHRIKQNVTE